MTKKKKSSSYVDFMSTILKGTTEPCGVAYGLAMIADAIRTLGERDEYAQVVGPRGTKFKAEEIDALLASDVLDGCAYCDHCANYVQGEGCEYDCEGGEAFEPTNGEDEICPACSKLIHYERDRKGLSSWPFSCCPHCGESVRCSVCNMLFLKEKAFRYAPSLCPDCWAARMEDV